MSAPTDEEVASDQDLPPPPPPPLNSRRLTAEILSRIARALDLPTTASVEETRQLIERKLGEEHEPRNVQVELEQLASGGGGIRLRGPDGVILDIPLEGRAHEEREIHNEDRGHESEEEEDGGGGARHEDVAVASREEELTMRVADVEAELESARDHAHKLESELERVQEARQRLEDQLTVEVSRVSDQVRDEKERNRTLWRLNCAQLEEYDEALAKKDEENHMLREKLGALETRMRSMVPSEHVGSVRDTTSVSHASSGGEPGEAVVPVPDPGRGPSRTPPRVSRREARSSYAHDGGSPSRIAVRTKLHDVLCPTSATLEEGTRPADEACEKTG